MRENDVTHIEVNRLNLRPCLLHLSLTPPPRLSHTIYQYQAKLLSVEFKAISADERAKWDKLAIEDKERYQGEMEDYEPPSDEEEAPAAATKKRKKKDPNAPKRNMSAYFIYSQEIRPTIREESPEATFGMIAKVSLLTFAQAHH